MSIKVKEQKVKATSLDNLFNTWFDRTEKDVLIAKKIMGYTFNMKVIVSRNIPPRDSMFDFIRDFGSDKLDDICGEKEKPLRENLLFVFPEVFVST